MTHVYFSGDLTRNLSEGRHILAHVKFTLELECGEMNFTTEFSLLHQNPGLDSQHFVPWLERKIVA